MFSIQTKGKIQISTGRSYRGTKNTSLDTLCSSIMQTLGSVSVLGPQKGLRSEKNKNLLIFYVFVGKSAPEVYPLTGENEIKRKTPSKSICSTE